MGVSNEHSVCVVKAPTRRALSSASTSPASGRGDEQIGGIRFQIIRATTGILRNIAVSAQLIARVPANTIANLTPAGSEKS